MAAVTTFEIHASDPDASAGFYRDLFGWDFIEHAFGDTSFWEIRTGASSGAMGRMIRRMGPAPAPGAPVMGAVITVEVDDISGCEKRAAARGASVALPKFPMPGVGWAMYFHDPDHNVLGVFQPDPEAR